MRIVVALLAMAVVVLGQDCQDCPGACSKAAKKAAPATLSAKIVKLEARAEKGCKKSEAKLAALCKAAGATDIKDLKARVAAYEKYAPCGCDVSKQKLAELSALLAPKAAQPVVSTRVSLLLATAAQGDAKSKELLKRLCAECCPPDCCDCPKKKECGDECAEACDKACGEKLVGAIRTMESSAQGGCEKSAAKLAKMQTVLATLPTASSRVAVLISKGDAESKAVVKWLCEECCPEGCCSGSDCTAEKKGEPVAGLVGWVKTLETSAARGCDKSAATLVRIEAKLSGAATAEPAPKQKKKDCSGCPSGGGCPSQQ